MSTPPIPIGLATPPTPRYGPKHDPPVRRGKDLDKHEVDFAPVDGLDVKEKEGANTVETGLSKLNQHTLSRLGLPTPAKTPSKKRRTVEPGVASSSAKLLFGDEIRRKPTASVRAAAASQVDPFGFAEPTLPSRRAAKKNDVFADEPEFEIYTDSNLRTPEMDDSLDNPFVEHEEDYSPQKIRKLRDARHKQEKKFAALGGNREDGAVYTFRGKKFFKKFDEDHPHQKVQPRLLFPSAAQLRARQQIEEDLDVDSSEDEDAPASPPAITSPRSNGSVADSGRITKSKAFPETPKTPRVTRSVTRQSGDQSPGRELRSAKVPTTPKTPVRATAPVPRTPPRRAAKRKAYESLSPEKTTLDSPRKKRLRG